MGIDNRDLDVPLDLIVILFVFDFLLQHKRFSLVACGRQRQIRDPWLFHHNHVQMVWIVGRYGANAVELHPERSQ